MTRFMLPGAQVATRTSKPQVPLILSVLGFVVLASGYSLWRHQQTVGAQPSQEVPAATPVPTEPQVTSPDVEDVANHLAHVRSSLIEASENARRAQRRLRVVALVLEQNYLQIQKRRLEAADADCETVVRDAARALEELELAEASLKTRREKP
ncbi:MAG: hypothetical protein L0338_19295 [Acidobacteria bacterium]|nr:hypothetical protein [Acidobacteriota bacterium]